MTDDEALMMVVVTGGIPDICPSKLFQIECEHFTFEGYFCVFLIVFGCEIWLSKILFRNDKYQLRVVVGVVSVGNTPILHRLEPNLFQITKEWF